MPVTKTAKRALRGAKRKESVNLLIRKNLELAIRVAKINRSAEKIATAIRLADRAAKKKVIHKNKASRIKRALSKLTPKIARKKRAVAKSRKAKKK